MHPTNDLAQFALYRQALSSYNLITGIDTDQTPTKNALALFESFAKQYPRSEYLPKVQEKLPIAAASWPSTRSMSAVSTIVPIITRLLPPAWNWPLSIFLTTPVMTKPFFISASHIWKQNSWIRCGQLLRVWCGSTHPANT